MDSQTADTMQETPPNQDWDDEYKHQRMNVCSDRHVKVHTAVVNGLFDLDQKDDASRLIDYFDPKYKQRRNLLVVIDGQLPQSMRTKAESYFEKCKTKNLLQDYEILALSVPPTERNWDKVSTVVSVARKLRLRRRDLFVAIGSTAVTDVVGFAASTYRRSTPWVAIPTDLVGILSCSGCNHKVSLDHTTEDGKFHRAKFSLPHPPVASFSDFNFLGPFDEHEIKRAKAMMIDLTVCKGDGLLSHLETYVDKMSANPQEEAHLLAGVRLAVDAKIGAIDKLPNEHEQGATKVNFIEIAKETIDRLLDDLVIDDGYSTTLAVALTVALLSVSKSLSKVDFECVTSLIQRAELPIYDNRVEADALWIGLIHSVRSRPESSVLMFPLSLGIEGPLKFEDFSFEDIRETLLVLRDFSSTSSSSKISEPKSEETSEHEYSQQDHTANTCCEQSAVHNVQYHVVSVPEIFEASNKTLIQDYCVDHTHGRKKKILVVMDDHLADTTSVIENYFSVNRASIDNYRVFPMQVSSKGKDLDNTLKVVNAAMDLGMTRQDLFIVVGGGTIMDIIGFAAAFFEGGTPYLRIPTTLVGMIDAGVGAKVGVNFKSSKSLIGGYFPPVACLNDPVSFLIRLPRRQFACGLAEAIKMAIMKSSRLFEVIERYQRDVKLNNNSFEMMYLATRTMLEELEPNLYEHDLRRLPDFGHEFGHIVESLAGNEIPHGECVAIGMAISSFIAYLKGSLAQHDLERILNCLLDLGLPIYASDYDCCNPEILWEKISTEGVEHKDGMLWLVVPETIGRGGFIPKVSEIDAQLVKEAVLGLKQYAGQYNSDAASTTNSSIKTGESLSKEVSISETSGESVGDKESLRSSGRSLLSIPELALSNGPKRETTTAAILGASSDIGSQLACYLVRQGMQVLCCVRPASLDSFMAKTIEANQQMRVLAGELLDPANLRLVIEQAEVLYNMAGIVTLGAKPEAFARVIAINGFAQGSIAHMIRQSGKEQEIKVIYPSTQRVHLVIKDASVTSWIKDAAQAFFDSQEALAAEPNMLAALEQFAEQLLVNHPLPAGPNVYEISKRLGEYFVSLLPRHLIVRITGAYGPSFSRGFVYRATNPKSEGNSESAEIRDFIYVDDLNEVLCKAGLNQVSDNETFDAASGESVDLQDVWNILREIIGDHAPVVFKGQATPDAMKLDPTFARKLLGRDFTSIHQGLRKTVEASSPDVLRPRPIVSFKHPQTFEVTDNEELPPSIHSVTFENRNNGVCIHDVRSPALNTLEQCLNRWFNQLSSSHKNVLADKINLPSRIYVRLRPASTMSQGGEFTLEQAGPDSWSGFIDINSALAATANRPQVLGKMEDVVGRIGHHLLAFVLRDQMPLMSFEEKGRELAMAGNWRNYLQYRGKPPVILLDVGATYFRIAIMGSDGQLLHEPQRVPSPSKLSYPQDTLEDLQERLMETLASEINSNVTSHGNMSFEEVGVSFGAVISNDGIVKDASVMWGDAARGYDFGKSLTEHLPGLRVTIMNDVSAAAWRYQDQGRFCLITVSSGLSNKVFNPDLRSLDQLDLDTAGIGGEMGHVVVEPRAVDMAVQHARSQATTYPKEFSQSRLSILAHENSQNISARHLANAARGGDEFALRLLEEVDVPHCPCGNLADLCSYSSGRAALRYAQRLASRGSYDIALKDVTNEWLQQAIAKSHPLALKVLYDSTYSLALRILQLAADIGLKKFIVVGGFALKTGRLAYLQMLREHLVRFHHQSAYFGDWTERDIRELVQFGIDDDNDGLVGMGNFVRHLREHYRAVEKAVGEQSLTLATRSIPPCGAQDVLVKVVFSGVCTTDLQIFRAERGHEPIVLGHEGVCQVVQVGREVKGLDVGEMVILNPNNPLDDFDKLGHTREGLYQEYFKFGKEFIDRGQVLNLGRSAVSASDTLVEPLSCVVAAQERIRDRIPGKNVLVVGAGMMGLLFVLMNAKMGARNVFLANRSKGNLQFAITRQIVKEENTFVIGEDFQSQVNKVSAGEGVDIIVICVSLGHGVRATQNAIASINAEGCVYLFAGFRPGDIITADEDAKIEAWPIRTQWRTEKIKNGGKPVDLSGHRGCRKEDLATAARAIRDDNFTFGRVVSHVISLDLLPEVMLTLAESGSIYGSPAKRVVIDMSAPNGTVNSTEELPLRHLHEAARKNKDAISMGNLFRDIGFESDASFLGWVYPPLWQEIKPIVEMAANLRSLKSKRHFIWVGTGAWGFLVDGLLQSISASEGVAFHTLQSLHPQALADLFASIDDLSSAVCLGVSQSGRTIETGMLMNSLRERFDTAGLDYRNHFIWLTDTRTSMHDKKRGEAVIRSLQDHDWQDADMMPLTIGNRGDINALFCVPHTTPVFLSMSILLGGDLKAVQRIYQQYLAFRTEIVHQALEPAYYVASNHIEHIQVSLDESIASATERLVNQLINQGLGSKQDGYSPRACLTSGNETAGPGQLKLQMPAESANAVKMMLTCNAVAVFVAMVAYHRSFDFVSHPKVNLYKRKAKELMATSPAEQKDSSFDSVIDGIVAQLNSNHEIRFAQVLYYGNIESSSRQNLKKRLMSHLIQNDRSIQVDVVQGEEWNHSRYQAAVQIQDTLYVILAPTSLGLPVTGIPEKVIQGNVRMLQSIGRATYETLLPKALYFHVSDQFLDHDLPIAAS